LSFSPDHTIDVLPTHVSYRPDESVTVEVTVPDGADAVLHVLHLGDQVATMPVHGSGLVAVEPLPVGGYGVEVHLDGAIARTAVEVTETPRGRLRYGFVASYAPGRDFRDVVRNARRLHLNGIQFYDWAYRHANLRGGGEEYRDALGQPVALETVRRLISGLHEAGAEALGYAAVYAVAPRSGRSGSSMRSCRAAANRMALVTSSSSSTLPHPSGAHIWRMSSAKLWPCWGSTASI